MKRPQLASLLALCAVLSLSTRAMAGGGRSYRTSQRSVRPNPAVHRSTVDVNKTYRPAPRATAYRYGLATAAARQAQQRKASGAFSDSATMRTVRTFLGADSRYGLVNGAGSIYAGSASNPYTYRQRHDTGRKVAGTAVMGVNLLRNLGRAISR